MSEQQNIEFIKSGYAAFTQGDSQTLLDFFSEDLDLQHPMPRSIWPWAGKRNGRAGLAEFVAGLYETVEYEQFEPREFIAQGDQVAVLCFERTRVKATGVVFEIFEVHVFKFKGSKVVQFLIFEDTAPIIAALQGYRKERASG
jgi:ketosteroid isomerase-like protein